MPMRAGIPLISEVDAAIKGELYGDIIASIGLVRRLECGPWRRALLEPVVLVWMSRS